MSSPASPPSVKEACVQAARELIALQGPHQLSLREVARRLGISHQAPYKHFATREHLVAEVMERCYRDFADALERRTRHDDPRKDLRALARSCASYARRHPEEYRLMFDTPWPEPAEHPGLVRAANRAFGVLQKVLRRQHGADAAGRRAADLDAVFLWSVTHGFLGIASTRIMPLLGLSSAVARRMPAHVMHAMWRAISPEGAARDR